MICRKGEICRVNEKKKQKAIVKRIICRIITCTGVGIILLLAVPAAVCSVMIAAVWFLTDKIISSINGGEDF